MACGAHNTHTRRTHDARTCGAIDMLRSRNRGDHTASPTESIPTNAAAAASERGKATIQNGESAEM